MQQSMMDRRRIARWTAIAGGVFAVFFIAGLLMLLVYLRLNHPDQEWIAWFEDGGNRTRQIAGAFLVVLSSLAFVIFVAGFVRLTDAAKSQHLSSELALAAGVLFAAMAMLGSLTLAAVSAVMTFGPDRSGTPDADMMRFLDQAGLHGIIGVAGGWSAALCVAALAGRAHRSGFLPRKLAIAGFVVAALLLASPAFAPLFSLPLWVIVVAVVIGRRGHPASPERGENHGAGESLGDAGNEVPDNTVSPEGKF